MVGFFVGYFFIITSKLVFVNRFKKNILKILVCDRNPKPNLKMRIILKKKPKKNQKKLENPLTKTSKLVIIKEWERKTKRTTEESRRQRTQAQTRTGERTRGKRQASKARSRKPTTTTTEAHLATWRPHPAGTSPGNPRTRGKPEAKRTRKAETQRTEDNRGGATPHNPTTATRPQRRNHRAAETQGRQATERRNRNHRSSPHPQPQPQPQPSAHPLITSFLFGQP